MPAFTPAPRRRLLAFALVAAAGLVGLPACSGGGDGQAPAGGGNFTAGTAPSISVQPAAQSVIAPAAATFSVTATGSPAPSYQWQISVDNGATFTDIGGATSSTYTTGPTSATQSGELFRVVLTNATATSTSNAAMLTVAPSVGLAHDDGAIRAG